jgi:hypothetical protein
MDSKPKWKTIEIKPKEQVEAERLFNQYCYPITRSWDVQERDFVKEAAVQILSSEFASCIKDEGLKGHAGRKNVYPVDLGHLIIHLVKYAHYERLVNLPYLPLDIQRGTILKEFDKLFTEICEILQEGGVRLDRFKKVGQECRKKLSARAAEGKISPYWRESVDEKIYPGHKYIPNRQAPHMFAACRFADVFLGFIPQAPTARIVEWVNIILTALSRPTVSKSSLNDYISNSRKNPEISIGTSLLITE